jgi:hypothetical protein
LVVTLTLWIQRRLAAVEVQERNAETAVLQQELALALEVSVDLGACPHRAKRAAVVALVGRVHDDLLRPLRSGEPEVEGFLERAKLVERDRVGRKGRLALEARPEVFDHR